MTTTRIEWRKPRLYTSSGEDGYVAGIHLFSYGYWGQVKETPYKVYTTLPGFKRDLAPVASPEAAKARCERMLAVFVGQLGAVFPATDAAEEAAR
jgi:hypothetical protein